MSKKHILSLLIASSLSACGGSSSNKAEVTPAPQEPAPTVKVTQTTGVITGFGSIFINGIEYETGSATISIDDNSGASEQDLRVGMVVTLKGEVNADGVTGNADSVDYEEQIKGRLMSINHTKKTLLILGQTVYFDDLTNFDEVTATELVAGDILEIDGFFKADGFLYATRIEKENELSHFKIQGMIEQLNTTDQTFTLGTLTIDYSAATFDDFTEADIADGQIVQVKGAQTALINQVFMINEIELEDAKDDYKTGDNHHIEGFITAVESTNRFMVGQTTVITNSDTEFEYGSAESLTLNTKVKVKGEYIASGELLADEIYINNNSNIALEGAIEVINFDLQTLTVFGTEFKANKQTKIKDDSDKKVRYFSFADLTIGDFIEIKGFVDADGHNIAIKIEREDNDETDEVELKGAVSNIQDNSFIILGVTIYTDESTIFENIEGDKVTSAIFFEQLQEGVIVEVEGQTVDGKFVATEVEIEEETE